MKFKIRINKTHVIVLCPLGHLIDSCELKYLAGSMFEADMSQPKGRFARLADNCCGSGHDKK